MDGFYYLQLHTLLTQIFQFCLRQEDLFMATQAQVRQDIATLHTTLTGAVTSIQAFQKAESDKIADLQAQMQKLVDAAKDADIPDDIDQMINDNNTLAQTISTQLLDPNQPPVTPPTPTPAPDQPVTPVTPVDPNQPVPPVTPTPDPNQPTPVNPVVPPVTPTPDPNQPPVTPPVTPPVDPNQAAPPQAPTA